MDNEQLPKWKTVDSKYLVNDRWLKLRADTCLTPDGDTIGPWYVLEYSDWISCLAIDRDDNVILLRHYRHGVDEYVPEIVGGGVDPEDESPKIAAIRELQEEIGYEGGELYSVGEAFANPSNQTNTMHVFLAVGGACTHERLKEIGADFVVETMPFKDFVAQVMSPTPAAKYQSLHLASIFLALNFIRSTKDPSETIARLRSLM
jgi:8-oxo-dGTP pyrophosphatase MutT (NUDIX family)